MTIGNKAIFNTFTALQVLREHQYHSETYLSAGGRYQGKPWNNYGDTQIQVNDRMCSLGQVGALVQNLKANLSEESQDNLIINLRADRNTDMGIVNDLKKELRDVGALTIRYSATEKSPIASK